MIRRLFGDLSNDYDDDDDNYEVDDHDYNEADADNADNVIHSMIGFTIIPAGVCGCDGNVFHIEKDPEITECERKHGKLVTVEISKREKFRLGLGT